MAEKMYPRAFENLKDLQVSLVAGGEHGLRFMEPTPSASKTLLGGDGMLRPEQAESFTEKVVSNLKVGIDWDEATSLGRMERRPAQIGRWVSTGPFSSIRTGIDQPVGASVSVSGSVVLRRDGIPVGPPVTMSGCGGWLVTRNGIAVAKGPECLLLGQECADDVLVRLGHLEPERAVRRFSDWTRCEGPPGWTRKAEDGDACWAADDASRVEIDRELVTFGKLAPSRAFKGGETASAKAEALHKAGVISAEEKAHLVAQDDASAPTVKQGDGVLYGPLITSPDTLMSEYLTAEDVAILSGADIGVKPSSSDQSVIRLGRLGLISYVSLTLTNMGREWLAKRYVSAKLIDPEAPQSWCSSEVPAHFGVDGSGASKSVGATTRWLDERIAGVARAIGCSESDLTLVAAEPGPSPETVKYTFKQKGGQAISAFAEVPKAPTVNPPAWTTIPDSAMHTVALAAPTRGPLYDQDKSPIYPGVFVEVTPAPENSNVVWEVRAVNYTAGKATVRQPRGTSWRLAEVELHQLTITKKPRGWNALAGLADWEGILAAIMANPPKAVLEMGQKKGVAWERFLVGIADAREVIDTRAQYVKSGGYIADWLDGVWSVAFAVQQALLSGQREVGFKGLGYPGQSQRDYTPRAMR